MEVFLREVLYGGFVILMVSSVWALAWNNQPGQNPQYFPGDAALHNAAMAASQDEPSSEPMNLAIHSN